MNDIQTDIELERQQRYDDMLLMRTLDEKLGIERHIVINPLLEINQRIIEYVHQFDNLSIDYLTLQAIQDFRNCYILLQVKKLDRNKSVLILRDEKNTKIFINQSVNREQLKEGNVFYFIREEFISKE